MSISAVRLSDPNALLDDLSLSTRIAQGNVWPPAVAQVMQMYQPGAIVVCGGADSLSGDRLGCFNLSLQVCFDMQYSYCKIRFQATTAQVCSSHSTGGPTDLCCIAFLHLLNLAVACSVLQYSHL